MGISSTIQSEYLGPPGLTKRPPTYSLTNDSVNIHSPAIIVLAKPIHYPAQDNNS